MMEALLLGLGVGLGAGISPGPLMALVITSTLERGFGAGMRVAAAPIITDLPIVVLCLWLVSSLPERFLYVLTLLGGAFVVYLGLATIARSRRQEKFSTEAGEASSRDLWHGALVNVLSPHPWLFWLMVGGPVCVSLWRESSAASVLWVTGFYTGLIGAKMALAGAVARGRRRLEERWYKVILALCGLLLVGIGLVLAAQGALPLLGHDVS